jgi:hypothetical protein
MEKQRTGFWRGFTWKRMLVYFLSTFLLTLGFDMLVDFHHAGKFLQSGSLLKRFIMAAVLSFIFSLWTEPTHVDASKKASAEKREA